MRRAVAVFVMLGVLGGIRSAPAQSPARPSGDRSSPSRPAAPDEPRRVAPPTAAPPTAANGAPRGELRDETELARIVGLYEAGKYAECASELGALIGPEARRRLRDREVIENARIYHAACLIGSGQPELADEPLRAAIRDNVQMKTPDSLVFPPPVVERFLRVRESLFDEIRQAEARRVEAVRRAAAEQVARERAEADRVAELERLASREYVVVRNRRWVGFIPFGVGQFQNGNEGLGWVFLTGESVLAATALTSLGMQTYLSRDADRVQNSQNNAVLSTWHTLLQVSSYGLLAVTAIGITEAQLSFVPEVREVRERPLPTRLRRNAEKASIAPSVAGGPDALLLGVSGRF